MDVRARQLRAVQALAEPRLVEMGHPVKHLDMAALGELFDRATGLGDGLHYELDLGGVPCALSIWNIGVDGVAAEYEEILDAEVTGLRNRGRLAVHIVNFFDNALALRSELLAAPSLERPRYPELEAEIRSTLQRFWEPNVIARALVERAAAESRSAP